MTCPCCSGLIPPLVLEEAKTFFDSIGVHFTFHMGQTKGWRIRSKLAVRGTTSKPLIGLFKEGTHEVVDMPDCQMHHPKINEASLVLRKWMTDCGIAPYDEVKRTGELRYVQFVVERSTGKVQLTLVFNRLEMDSTLNNQIKILWDRDPALWHSIWFNGNNQNTNTIFGNTWKRLFGEEWLWESIVERKVCFKPSSFGQANLEAFEMLLSSLRGHILKNKNVSDFYAGIGVIGMSVLDISKKVLCCEINPYSKDCFDNTVSSFSSEDRSKISYQVGSAFENIKKLNESNVVIVDPPRKGLDKNLLESISEATHLEELIYISCGWDSFKRDCKHLLEKKWKLHVVEGYLFFPGTNHLETMAIFKRA